MRPLLGCTTMARGRLRSFNSVRRFSGLRVLRTLRVPENENIFLVVKGRRRKNLLDYFPLQKISALLHHSVAISRFFYHSDFT